MKKSKVSRVSSIALLSLVVLFSSSNQSFASEKVEPVNEQPLTINEKIESVEEFYKDDIQLQNKLIKKIKNDEEVDSERPNKKSLGEVVKLDENNIKVLYPDGSYELQGIDFSDSQVYDEDGNLLGGYNEVFPNGRTDLDNNLNLLNPSNNFEIAPLSIEGGTQTSGSGYVTVKGAQVYHKDMQLTVKFKADYSFTIGGYDILERVYAVDITAWDWNILSEGVFRSKETSTYSAYGGVKFQLRRSETSSLQTAWLYIRVGKDKVWEEKDVN